MSMSKYMIIATTIWHMGNNRYIYIYIFFFSLKKGGDSTQQWLQYQGHIHADINSCQLSGHRCSPSVSHWLEPCKMHESVFCVAVECVLLAWKASGECRKAPPLAHGRQKLASPQNMISSPHLKRGSGGPFSTRAEGEEREDALLKGNKKTSATSGNERMSNCAWQGILSSAGLEYCA